MSTDIEDELRQAARSRRSHELRAWPDESVSASEIAGKTLEERAADKIALLRAALSAATPPLGNRSAARQREAPARYRSAIVACARWETDNIVEWIAYHRSLGFDHTYLYCNDDDPRDLYEKLLPLVSGPEPYVTFQHYPLVGLQTSMYKHFVVNRSRECEWFIFLDIDEFLALKQHRNIGAFIADFEGHADGIYLNWVMFGHSGHEERPQGSVLRQYRKRSRFVNPYTKVLTRRGSLNVQDIVDNATSGFWHGWEGTSKQAMRLKNVLHQDMSSYYNNFPHGAQEWLDREDVHQRIIDMAVIHHYAFRSEKDIERRLQRGVSGDFGGQLAFKAVLDRGELATFLAPFNEVDDAFLSTYWDKLNQPPEACRVIPRPPGRNIALGKIATQSSVSEWSSGVSPADDASGAVSGTISGHGAFHTDHDPHPWWQVDLGENFFICEVRVFNRIDSAVFARRSNKLQLQIATEQENWMTVFTKIDDVPFGGVDGHPLIWRPAGRAVARFIKIQLLHPEFLHLDQVEVYGEPFTRAP